MKDEVVGGVCQTTHEEVCNQALEHYEQISTEVCHWNSLVPKAIKYYRDNHGKSIREAMESIVPEIQTINSEDYERTKWIKQGYNEAVHKMDSKIREYFTKEGGK